MQILPRGIGRQPLDEAQCVGLDGCVLPDSIDGDFAGRELTRENDAMIVTAWAD